MGGRGRVAVHSDISAFKGSGRNRLNIRNTLRSGHADGDIAAGSDRGDRNLDSASLTDKSCAEKHTILADSHVRTRNSAHLIGLHADGEDGHVAHLVGSGLHTIRHNGTVTEDMVSLPIIKSFAMKLISKSLSGIAGKETDVKYRVYGVIGVIRPDGIVNT